MSDEQHIPKGYHVIEDADGERLVKTRISPLETCIACSMADQSLVAAARVELAELRSNLANLKAIGEQLRTQDNRITQNPMFCVQEQRRLVGMDSNYSEKRCWHDSANDRTIYDDDPDFIEVPEGDEWDEFGYVDQWFTVMAAFTEAGCFEYLRLNGHNLNKPRIYVESFNRCPEMIEIRKALMEITERD